MDEQAKIVLYKQLMKLEIFAKMKKENTLMDWEEFIKLDDATAFKYTIKYRNTAYKKYCEKKIRIKDKEKNEFYLELPDMNLSGKDLNGVYLHMFMTGYAKERNNGKMIFKTSSVNLKNTNCVINMATIHPIIVSDDGINIKEISADITKCDFRGCKVFGKFQNTKAKLEFKEENLPEKYIARLKEFQVPKEIEITTDYVQINMLENKIIKGINGIDKVKQMVDYDLTGVGKNIWKYRETIMKNPIDISYTGAFIDEYGLDSVGKENYYIDIESRARDAYIEGNMDTVNEFFDNLDKEAKKNIIALAVRDGRIDFIKEHRKELSGMQRKYIELQSMGQKNLEEENNTKELLRKKYKEGNSIEFVQYFTDASINVRSDIIEEIYKMGDLKFIETCLNDIDDRVKNEIFITEYKKGNNKFVIDNFSKLNDDELKAKIIKAEFEKDNFQFLYANYNIITDEEIKEKIMKTAFNTGNTRFLKRYFDDLPKNMQIEAVIKYKDLGIPEGKVLKLLQ